MDKVKEIMKAMGILPRIRFSHRGKNERGKEVNISDGPKKIKILEEPKVTGGEKFEGGKTKFFRIPVEYDGRKYSWKVDILTEDNQPRESMLEKLALMEVGKEYIVELKTKGMVMYYTVLNADGSPLLEEGASEIPESEASDEDEDDTPTGGEQIPW